MAEEVALTFRPSTSEDLRFVHDSWGSSYFKGNKAHRLLTPDEFHQFHRPIRERFLSKIGSKVLICSPEDDPWHILGWIATEQLPSATVLHYLYVREVAKREGIAGFLIKRAIQITPVIYTHLTDQAAKIMSKKYDSFTGFIHIPHLV
jgi:hypothetical protein